MKIALVGTGNVASQLARRIQELNIEIYGVLGSTTLKTAQFSEKFGVTALYSIQDLANADLTLLCVQDSKLAELIPAIAELSPTATTSGSFNISAFNEYHFPVGVFYPLQTFTPEVEIDFKTIPFFIESKNTALKESLHVLANQIGKTGIDLSSEERTHLHLTAVFVNNFSHHINVLAREYAEANQIEFSWFDALLHETFRKIKAGALNEDQTGPAKRHDLVSIEKHLDLLDTEKKKVYQALTDSILQKFPK